MKPPIKRYGGKIKLAPYIVPLLPPHETYVEIFGGSGAVLFAKEPSKVEIYNDLDKDMFNFYQVVRDKGRDLRDSLRLTLFSRDEFESAKEDFEQIQDPVERARRFSVLMTQSIDACGKSWSRSGKRNGGKPFLDYVERIAWAAQRLRHVQIENTDCRKLILDLDGPNVLFYADRPYVHDARTESKAYKHEMSEDDHKELLELLCSVQGMVVLSGYDDPLYNQALTDWERHEIEVPNYAAVKRNGGNGSKRSRNTEIIWLNPKAAMARKAEE